MASFLKPSAVERVRAIETGRTEPDVIVDSIERHLGAYRAEHYGERPRCVFVFVFEPQRAYFIETRDSIWLTEELKKKEAAAPRNWLVLERFIDY